MLTLNIALGQGLITRGHKVTLCTSASFEKVITASGLNYGYINNQMIEFIHSDAGRRLIENTTSVFALLKTYIRVAKKIKPMQQSIIEDSGLSTLQANPDLILFHPKAIGAIHFADKLNVPAVLTLLQPMSVPTREFPSAVFKPKNWGGWYNKLSYTIILRLSALGTKQLSANWRKRNRLPAKHKSKNLLLDCAGKPMMVLHGFSSHIVPRPKDWPDNAVTCGYWFAQTSADWQPPEQWIEFFNAGDKPVYVGFGSMAGTKAVRLGRLIIEALQKAKVRAVIAKGWGGLDIESVPDSALLIDQAPHDWLFPRMKAVIHHGGAGTTASAIRAGCPQIVCPFCVDQPFWGWRVHHLGLGVKPIRQKSLTVDKLVHAIRTVTSNQTILNNVNLYQEKLAQEDGVANAIGFIEQMALTDKSE